MTTNANTARDQKFCDECWGPNDNPECPKCYGTGYLPTALSAGYVARHSFGASERQVPLMDKLMAEYLDLLDESVLTDEVRAAFAQGLEEAKATKATASKFIDAMIATIKRTRQAKAEKAQAEQVARVQERKQGQRNDADVDGMYLLPDGRIVKVQYAVHGSGNPYAKLLTKLDTPTIKRGKRVDYGFEYAPGLVRECKPEHKMTLEQAKEWGALYGACCCCGATLTDEVSIEAGIGPICGKRFG